MKKGYVIPAAILTAIFALCLWNSASMNSHTTRWRGQLERADRLVQSGEWEASAAAIREGYADWTGCQTWLHCVSNHDVVDGAEAMYHRALAFAQTREESELRAELADLQNQLRMLAEREEFSLRNVL